MTDEPTPTWIYAVLFLYGVVSILLLLWFTRAYQI